MRYASIILPRLDNLGADLGGVHNALQTALVDTFGGFTASPVSGGWRDEKSGEIFVDESVEYRIAAVWGPVERESLIDLANLYGLKAGQLAVCIQHGNGDVQFIEPRAPAPVEARPITAAQRRAADFARDLERGEARRAKVANAA